MGGSRPASPPWPGVEGGPFCQVTHVVENDSNKSGDFSRFDYALLAA